jgi:hypothetical protein
MTGEFANLPADLPRPVDDGAPAHLSLIVRSDVI